MLFLFPSRDVRNEPNNLSFLCRNCPTGCSIIIMPATKFVWPRRKRNVRVWPTIAVRKNETTVLIPPGNPPKSRVFIVTFVRELFQRKQKQEINAGRKKVQI